MSGFDNSVFLLLCAALVLFMQLGFSMLESGLVESRHCISVLFKNIMDVCVGILAYVFLGSLIQFYLDPSFVFDAWRVAAEWQGNEHPAALLVYNAMFAATAATIMSGTIAGRAHVGPYLILSTTVTALLYPTVALLIWGYGEEIFHDFAGSIVVHVVGGMAALGAALALKPRDDPAPKPHNMPLAMIGTLTLWFGWYGFNLGSINSLVGAPEGVLEVSRVAMNTTLAAAAGGAFTWLFQASGLKEKSLPEVLNGILGGLVMVTASADLLQVWVTPMLGFISAVVVSYWPDYIAGRRFFGTRQIDDPVGAIPV
jgi:Amt family ammonium transporter